MATLSTLGVGVEARRARADADLEWPSGELIFHAAIDRRDLENTTWLKHEQCTHRHGSQKQATICASKRLVGTARAGWKEIP